MSSNWKTKPLGEVASNVSRRFNFTGKDKVVFINTGDVLEGAFLHSNYSDPKGLPGQAKKAIEKGDILYSEIRPGNKRYVLVDFDPKDYVVSTKFMVIKPTDEILPEFLYLILTSRDCEQEFKIIADSRSGTFPQVTFDSISYFPINYPDKAEQKRILQITDSLSGKLAVNAKTNQTLEQIAQAIFKSWFVDFDPVKAKIEALAAGGCADDAELAAMRVISAKTLDELNSLKASNPEAFNKLAQTAALFPAAMQDSELGEIPEGWEVNRISEFGSVICGKTPSKAKPEFFGEAIPFIKIPDMHNSMFVVKASEYLSQAGAKSQPKKNLPRGSICVSSIATVGKVVITREQSQTNQQINSIIPHEVFYTPYLYFYMGQLEKHFHDLASGGSATLNMNTTTFSKVCLLKPSNDILLSFYDSVKEHLALIENNMLLNQNLGEVRDTLLPKLLSGEINVTSEVVE